MEEFGMKKTIAIFLIGCICGALVLGAVLALRAFGVALRSWGGTTVACSDIEVRQAIERSGINLPPASWNLFYANDNGWPDSFQWITLTVSHDELWRVVEASLHKKKMDFASGFPKDFTSWDHITVGEDQKIDTSLWTPRSIKNPLHFSVRRGEPSSQDCEDWIVDEEGGRIFIVKWTT